ncbi:MAG TPA: amino acid--tRNA ligase-related protein, partial [Thermoplasmata archaeon]|nr:amino acid--tRNA ligase-related protein [Thermoplasmata archaeon]
MAFALVRDGSGTTQVTLKKGAADPSLFSLFADAPRESVVEVEGTVRRSEKSHRGVELFPTSAHLVTRAESPLPLGVVDKVGVDLGTRFDHRILDLRKPAVRAVFELRSCLLETMRDAYLRRGFLEVETPKLLRQGAEGGATLFPVDYFGQRAYLAQSPQLYKQMLIGAGFERVFEIAPAFRAEPSDTVRHTTEFSSLDAEIGFIDSVEDVRSTLEGVVVDAFASTKQELEGRGNALSGNIPTPKTPFPRIPFATCMEWLGRPGSEDDLGSEDEKAVGERVDRELGADLYFITDYPTAIKAGT